MFITMPELADRAFPGSGLRFPVLITLLLLLASCNLSPEQWSAELSQSPDGTEIRPETATPDFPGITDENAVMTGICFESAQDAAGQVFVMRNEGELSHFFDLADHSHLCRRAVERHSFDFSDGQILAGIWSYGHGCKAHHDILAVDRDDSTKHLTLHLRFVTEGDCNYELVRPFWVGLSGVTDYQIALTIE